MIENLLETIQDLTPKNLQLYFITRVLKKGLKKSAKSMDKFDYKLYRVDVNPDIREHLYDLTVDQLEFMHKKNFEVSDYDVISDDTQQIFTYQMKTKALSFADVIYNVLPKKSKIKTIQNIESIVLDEEMWAYCVGFDNEGEWIYTFRKILSGKVAIDEKKGSKKGKMNSIRTYFSTKSNKLELLHGETVNLDKQIDCVFWEDAFYIFKKTQFEQIVGLAEEFKKVAEDVVESLKNSNMIEGVELISKEVAETPSIHKKLVRLQKTGNADNITTESIALMRQVGKEFNLELKCKDGKIQIEDKNDIDVALKLLCDYYKEGKVSGKNYGTYAGKQLPVN
ncbi:uncharacterized protein DUF4868 [Ancylomarina subtilis]|uniref:Uncharacterized protein DUF4868 n=1 Tax=Ancylomarina subtilis TaxID=1639035 RepID=A0A4Q7V9D9_9BACT|nr:Kiwa anti-phage protein KwaB-like domain-containing protein [Ancylomarina subtilis]RZT91292.1 uncharacterized protein DUF4868 [Ancylomarina subtilis]